MNERALAALLAALAAAGCSATSVRFTKEGGNPPFEQADHTYPEDGFQDRDVFRVCFDEAGELYPDPRPEPSEDGAVAGRSGRIAEDFGRRINEACLGKTLVILIHGMNTTYPESRRAYELARLKILDQFRGMDTAFLELYWDGRRGDPLTVWGYARPASKWVGLGLRRLLVHVSPRIPIRVLTHSRGASVITAALWNVPLSEEPRWDARYRDRQREIPLPSHPAIRLGLLAPAMPESDFDGCPALDRVIVGVNEHDPALGKSFLPSSWFGSTRLGCDLEAFREGVERKLNRDRAVAYGVDLSASGIHDFTDYLLRRAVSERFLPLLLEEGTDTTGAGDR